MTDDIDRADLELPAEVEALALKAIVNEAEAREKLAKALIGGDYPEGERRTFRSPVTGAKLGMVYRTDPEPRWQITDRPALLTHLRTFPGNLITQYEIVDEQAAVEVLRVHAPHLLAEVTTVDPEAEIAAVDQSRATGVAAAPGIERCKASGVLTVKPDREAFAEVGRLIAAGLLTWDARPVLPAGEAAS